ncbi:MAG: hypothetical protein GAK30_02130 [Paracidovorax wautersii]|uniref:DUF1868 domain-containing protein n=1 Tax=Paracidovorax wautersii TaxID=1177982 RepID=A0A7V8FNI4_9BURK|nr:MAG: hypothetical protein GAK30_02130 [Paracidovorax wautersii]
MTTTAPRRTFLGWTGVSALSAIGAIGAVGAATSTSPALAKNPATDCGQLALGKPSATGPGTKYDAAGHALNFPGNTLICHLNQPGATFTALTDIAAALRAQVGDNNLTWTPPSSYHMTVVDGVTNAGRRPGDWPHLLPLDAPLEDCNRYVADKLRRFDLGMDLPIRMVADETLATQTGTQFLLRPIDAAENARPRDLRNRISQAIGVRHPNHDSYGFHITFAYYIRPFATVAEERRYQSLWLTAIQELRRRVPVIEMGAPEYCLFDSMNDFKTQFLLARR